MKTVAVMFMFGFAVGLVGISVAQLAVAPAMARSTCNNNC
jgi:hypothetical protein